MSYWLAVGERVAVRAPTAGDEDAYLAALAASPALHRPWVSPTCSPAAFAQLLERNRRGDFHAYLLVRVDDGALVGAANLAVIEDRELSKAWIAFMAFVPHDGRGYMTEGLGPSCRTPSARCVCSASRPTCSAPTPVLWRS